MSIEHYHQMCNKYRGRAVEIRTRDGGVHRGIIENVNNRRVFIRPFERERNIGGFGYGFYGPRYGFGTGFGTGFGIALGAIVGLSVLPLFFW